MSRPSMTALLGLLAIAGYQNRDKISEWLGGLGGRGAMPGGQSQGGPASGGRTAGPAGMPPAGMPSGLDRILPSGGAGGLGSLIHDGLSQLVDQFKQAGHGDVADSWVGTGQNKAIASTDLETAIGPYTMDHLQQQTGLSKEELLSRLSRELPTAVDRYTPDGRLPGAA